MPGFLQKPPFIVGLNRSQPLSNGLIGAYPFTEKSANSPVYDVSGNGNHGVISGGVTPVGGAFGSAFNFDATGKITAGPALSITTNKITVSAWIRRDSTTGQQRVICKGYNEFILYFNAGSNAPIFYLTDISPRSVTANDSVNLNQWHQITGTYEESTGDLNIYIDGKLSNSVAASGNFDTADGFGLIFGGYQTETLKFDGDIDNPLIYDRVLSAKEINLLYQDSFRMYRFEGGMGWFQGVAPVTPVGVAIKVQSGIIDDILCQSSLKSPIRVNSRIVDDIKIKSAIR